MSGKPSVCKQSGNAEVITAAAVYAFVFALVRFGAPSEGRRLFSWQKPDDKQKSL